MNTWDVNRVQKVISDVPETLLVQNAKEGNNPLHIACHNNSSVQEVDGIDLVEGIISKSPKAIAMICIKCNNPLDIVCMSMPIDYRVIELLLDYSDKDIVSMHLQHISWREIIRLLSFEILFARRTQIINIING